MSRPTRSVKIKIVTLVLIVFALAFGVALDAAAHNQTQSPALASTKPALTTRLTYHGQNGKTALALLKEHAKVQTKTSSIGVYVTAINGNNGGGKKYWIYYVNGKESQVGAAAYVTHNGDVIQWRLQQ